jgi:hypothetical protein
MTWNYRVVRRVVPSNLTGGTEPLFGVHEAYYDDAGRCYAITAEPVTVIGDSESGIRETLLMMKVGALRRPVLDYDNVPEPGAINPAEKNRKRRGAR